MGVTHINGNEIKKARYHEKQILTLDHTLPDQLNQTIEELFI